MTAEPEQISSSEMVAKVRTCLDRAQAGQAFTITRWGVPVAQLIPYAPPEPVSSSQPGGELELGAPSLGLADAHGTVSGWQIAREAESG